MHETRVATTRLFCDQGWVGLCLKTGELTPSEDRSAEVPFPIYTSSRPAGTVPKELCDRAARDSVTPSPVHSLLMVNSFLTVLPPNSLLFLFCTTCSRDFSTLPTAACQYDQSLPPHSAHSRNPLYLSLRLECSCWTQYVSHRSASPRTFSRAKSCIS